MFSTDILILAGKRPKPDSVLHRVQVHLESHGLKIGIHWRDPLAELAASQHRLLVHRGLTPQTLSALSQALASHSSTAVINTPGACIAALDRQVALESLRQARLPVAQSFLCTDWAAVLRVLEKQAVYVKMASGAIGRGAGVVSLAQGSVVDAPFAGPWHVELAVPRDRFDRKIYVAGSRVFGLLKPWPRDDSPVIACQPSATVVSLAIAAGQATGLELYGLDLVGRNDKFTIVDLNPFPGYRGVDGADIAVADHIVTRLYGLPDR